MSHPDPSTYDREPPTASALIHVRYRGTCRECGRTVQSTPRLTAAAADDTLWIRCGDCGTVTRCGRSASSRTGTLGGNEQ